MSDAPETGPEDLELTGAWCDFRWETPRYDAIGEEPVKIGHECALLPGHAEQQHWCPCGARHELV